MLAVLIADAKASIRSRKTTTPISGMIATPLPIKDKIVELTKVLATVTHPSHRLSAMHTARRARNIALRTRNMNFP